VHEHLLVFLEPGIQRRPVEPDRAGQPRHRRAGEQPGRAGPLDPPGPQRMRLGCAAPALPGVAVRDEQITAHVRDRDVVLRVVRPLPHIQRPGGVEHPLAGQERPDAARHRLDMVDGGDRRRIVAHCGTPSDWLSLPETVSGPDRPASYLTDGGKTGGCKAANAAWESGWRPGIPRYRMAGASSKGASSRDSSKAGVAIVTGAGRGIGRATAVALARAGADVACVARTTSQLAETASQVRRADRRAWRSRRDGVRALAAVPVFVRPLCGRRRQPRSRRGRSWRRRKPGR
jgi:hypothetical protein